MKRFNFKLEPLLAIRAYREREAEIELGRRNGVLADIENRMRITAEEKVRAAANRFAKQNGLREMIYYNNYILRLDNTKETLIADAAKAELAIEEAREVYLDAARERKILDNLKERQEADYEKAARRAEVAVLDDISNGKAIRAAVVEA
jgi:flagellar FliJ protein